MPLKFPATFRNISADKGHPFFKQDVDLSKIVIFLNGEPKDHVVTASMDNGYIHVDVVDERGNVQPNPHRPDRIWRRRLKGKVEIFYEVEIP